MQKVLVIAAHPDDEILGVGATVKRLVSEGAEVRALIMAEGITSRAETREEADSDELKNLHNDAKKAAQIIGYKSIDFCDFPDNRMDSVDLLDIIKAVSKYIENYTPDTVFTHHHGDLNIDHRLTCEAVLTACRPVNNYCVKRIYAFETPSSTEWDYNYTQSFKPNFYVDVSNTFEDKIKGMACYKSEIANHPHPRSEKALRALGEYRGSNVGVQMAEAFEVLRECY